MLADAGYSGDVDYYALLGLSTDPPPTDADIRSAYRNLTLSFHPDKQPPHLQEAARQHFNQIQEAYNVLIDSQKRMVYDMMGAEGVKREWGHLGAMGREGEAETQEVGVKAMSPTQFRQWFLKTMKKRERKAIESLVGARSALTLGVDASNTITVEDDDDVTFHIPSPKLVTYGLKYNFETPIPVPDFLRASPGEDTAEEDSIEEEEDLLQLTISTGVKGRLQRPVQPITVTYEGHENEEEEIQVPLPPVLVGNALELGATVSPNFKGLLGTRGIWNRFPFSFLKESNVSFGALLLPTPAFTTTFVRSYQPVPGITPFNVAATTTIQRSLGQCPPSFQVQATKQLTERKVAVLTWNSGLLQWPGFLLEAFPALGLTAETFYAAMEDSSALQLALKSFSKPSKSQASHDGDFDDEEARRLEAEKEDIDRSEEAWDIALALAPGGAGIGLNYSRNLFSGKPTDDPAKSEWSSEGYFPMAKMDEARAVKLEVSTSLHSDGSIGWTVKGTRLISENTRIGLGVGITANNVAMTVTWKRLGQRINLPVVVMPHRHHDAAALAAVFPWLAYCAVEFGYVRPRNRKLRRQAVARRHKELNKLVPKKRAESEQAIEMMAEQVQRRQAREESHDGLVITKAEYGYYPSQSKKPKTGFTEPRVIDVTIPVAALVDRGQLVISKKMVKFQIMGFHDPAPLLPKRLKVWYNFQGQEHFVELGDKEGVACPLRAHVISH